MKHPILKSGIFRLSNSENAKESEFSLIKFVKRIFTKYGVPFIDKCCGTQNYLPVRFDNSNGTYEVFDGTTWNPVQGQISVSGLDVLQWDGSTWVLMGTLNV